MNANYIPKYYRIHFSKIIIAKQFMKEIFMNVYF